MSNDDAARAIIGLFRTSVLSTPIEVSTVDGVIDPRLFLEAAEIVKRQLSSGEQVLLGIVRAAWNGTGEVRVSQLRAMDRTLRLRVMAILTEAWSD